jgi:hypothetical protein
MIIKVVQWEPNTIFVSKEKIVTLYSRRKKLHLIMLSPNIGSLPLNWGILH